MGCCMNTATHFSSIWTDTTQNWALVLGFGFLTQFPLLPLAFVNTMPAITTTLSKTHYHHPPPPTITVWHSRPRPLCNLPQLFASNPVQNCVINNRVVEDMRGEDLPDLVLASKTGHTMKKTTGKDSEPLGNLQKPLQKSVQIYKPEELDHKGFAAQSLEKLPSHGRWRLGQQLCVAKMWLDVGTGCRKILGFTIPLVLHETDVALLVTPLTTLMIDQTCYDERQLFNLIVTGCKLQPLNSCSL